MNFFLSINDSRQQILLNWLFFLFVLVTVLTRVLVFFQLNMEFVDTDQTLMWLGASDYSRGLFYEPRFYGQNYNTFMEGLFAVPLVWMHVPVYYAVPIATHFIFLFPFIFTSIYLFKKGKKIHALFVLSVILCMPAEYEIMNSISRGFVTGLFFTGFFVLSILNPANLKFVLLNTVMAVIGYFVNPNSLIVSAPFLTWLFLFHYKDPKYYLINLSGLITAALLYLVLDRFYALHPNYKVFGLRLEFSLQHFVGDISSLDKVFGHISFFIANNCIPLLLCLILLFILIYDQKKVVTAFIVFIALTLFSFSARKNIDGSTWPFYSYSRMYLGIPLFICLCLPFVSFKKRWITYLLIIPLLFSTYKLTGLKKSIKSHTVNGTAPFIGIIPLSSALQAISFYKNICDEHDADLFIISTGFWIRTIISYGGPAIYNDYPTTQETVFERRTWIVEKNKDKVVEKFIFLSSISDFDKKITGSDFTVKRLDDYGLLLVTKNKLTISQFINTVMTIEPEI